MKGLWFFNWISNTFLSLSLGVVASLLIMGYTNARERNVAFYSDIIPVLENRHENMHKANLKRRKTGVRFKRITQ